MDRKYLLSALSFIQMIQSTSELLGTATSAVLRDIGKKLAGSKNSLEALQGPANEIKDGVFIQKECPFGDALELYIEMYGSVPEALKKLAEYANKHGSAWVSAFCGVHQNIRKTIDEDTIHIACKARDGSIHYADNDIITEDEAREILKKAVCIYVVKE